MIIGLNVLGQSYRSNAKNSKIYFSNYVDEDVVISGGKVNICYLNTRQTDINIIVLSIRVNGFKDIIRDFPIRFMDVEGNILEKDIENSISLMCEIINNFTAEHVNCNSSTEKVLKDFHSKLGEIMSGTAYKRKVELLDFNDPAVWEASKNPEAKTFSTEYLDKVKAMRKIEDSQFCNPPTKLDSVGNPIPTKQELLDCDTATEFFTKLGNPFKK